MNRQIILTRNTLLEENLLPDLSAEDMGWYYNSVTGSYYADTGNEFIVQKKEDLKARAREKGVPVTRSSQQANSKIDQLILDTQDRHSVSYIGPLAGHDRGLYRMPGGKVLVTESPQLVEPSPGSWPLLEGILLRMLGREQLMYFLCWLHVALEALYLRMPRPGQVVYFCGPVNSGKTLLQDILTLLLGGRSASPYQFATGATEFNEDLLTAGHLKVEDETPPDEIRTRRRLGNYIKQIAASNGVRLHGKHRCALDVRVHQRMTVSTNDEPKNLKLIPPLDESLRDKLIIFHVRQVPMPMPTATVTQITEFFDSLKAELPALVADVLTYQIPVRLEESRFGVRHYHHPEILRLLAETSEEELFLRYIDESLGEDGCWKQILRDRFPDPENPENLRITAEELSSLLVEEGMRWAEPIRRLLSYPHKAGQLLGDLKAHTPPGVIKQESRGSDNRNYWRLIPPSRR